MFVKSLGHRWFCGWIFLLCSFQNPLKVVQRRTAGLMKIRQALVCTSYICCLIQKSFCSSDGRTGVRLQSASSLGHADPCPPLKMKRHRTCDFQNQELGKTSSSGESRERFLHRGVSRTFPNVQLPAVSHEGEFWACWVNLWQNGPTDRSDPSREHCSCVGSCTEALLWRKTFKTKTRFKNYTGSFISKVCCSRLTLKGRDEVGNKD